MGHMAKAPPHWLRHSAFVLARNAPHTAVVDFFLVFHVRFSLRDLMRRFKSSFTLRRCAMSPLQERQSLRHTGDALRM
jgi:hypothetical protein